MVEIGKIPFHYGVSTNTCFVLATNFIKEQKPHKKTNRLRVSTVFLKHRKNLFYENTTSRVLEKFRCRISMALTGSYFMSTVSSIPPFLLSTEVVFERKDLIVAFADLLGATAWILCWQWVASKNWIERTISRKIVHMTCTPLFVLTWPFFTDSSGSRWVACLVPLIMGLRLWIAGKGWSSDTISKIVSRKGSIEEALKGPLYYVIVTFLVTLFCWKDSPLGIVALMQLCLGDGFAEVVGRRWGKSLTWPFCRDKSVIGTLAFSIAGFLASYCAVVYFNIVGMKFYGTEELSTFSLLIITLACSAVELVNFWDDNFSVPLMAILIGALLTRHS
ncbi:phosphatidate cytidylyltransferase/ phytol kinase [Galdieria sulphuraria]|uniref:Phosphatidate cytidylyltransferase/ phytol kinase n=1 Tax=Galdieria sulphuraria TaxID=130081 RepID=M2X1A7_GALSU|nr:phosphatidate cytidylyltransferase/ phytol kinase [Galdieria sulphuraria]EME30150.1 phosphatidate cytidylyltransferase/ phytol kinase [Galdieria sulphuraria]|eukprot:XP_005706670.1 phosphatidate cytidylyltransferase/ phytol kinase [Galdieria sulphuraria]